MQWIYLRQPVDIPCRLPSATAATWSSSFGRDLSSGLSMAALGILREYAKKSIPSPALPESVLFANTDATLTIFDAYPKVCPPFPLCL